MQIYIDTFHDARSGYFFMAGGPRRRPPFGTLQVAYQRGTVEFGERSEQGHTLFLKLTAVL